MLARNFCVALIFLHTCGLIPVLRAVRLQRAVPSTGSSFLNLTQLEGLTGTHPISKPGLPDDVWQMRKMLVERISLEDDPTCGAEITDRKQKLHATLAAMHEHHVKNSLAAEKPMQAVIVGGGPVGLVAAMEAWHGGATVHVLEQRNGYSRLQNVEVETPHNADKLLQDFFEAANALAEIYEVLYQDPPKASKDLVKIKAKDKHSIRIRLDKLMSAPLEERMCYYLSSSRHTCVIKTLETLLAASVALLGEKQPGSLNLVYFAQYLTTCGVPRKKDSEVRPRAVFRQVATREQRTAAPPELPCAEDLPNIPGVGLLVDATGGRGNVRKQFIGRKHGKHCPSHWQVRVASEATHNGVTVPLLDPEVHQISEALGIDHGEEDALSIVARRIDGVVCPRFNYNGLDFPFRLPVFDEDGSYLGKGEEALFSDYFWPGLPRFSENACQYVPLLRVPREENPIAQLLLLKAKASGKMRSDMSDHLREVGQAFMGKMHSLSPTNKKFKASDGGDYPIYEFDALSITLFKTTLRVPPHGDSLRGFPSDVKPTIVFAETGDQESPAYYRTGSGISAGADRASRLISIVQKLGSRTLGADDFVAWKADTLRLSLKKYCMATNYMLTNTMFPNRFFGIKKAAWGRSEDEKVCGGSVMGGCDLGLIFEAQCVQTIEKPGEVEKLIDPSTWSTSEVLNWFSLEGKGNECAEAAFSKELKRLEERGAREYYSTELTDM